MTIEQRIDELARYMAAQLQVKGQDFQGVVAKAGRKVPRRLRGDVRIIAEAETMSRNPKFARMINARSVDKAERRLRAFLAKHDPRTERRNEILDTVAKVAFVLVTVALALFFYLLSQGYFERS
ncbi:MAG: hypothetical protein AAF762_01915 [Pseudomonadota bacterium]